MSELDTVLDDEIHNMTLGDEITKAINTHWVWKTRLLSAIDTGKSDAAAVDVAKDHICEFGQWLYGPTIPAAETARKDYSVVCRLHADFHKCAATVLERVAHGQKAQAIALMNGEYAEVSVDLIAAMLKWKEAVGG